MDPIKINVNVEVGLKQTTLEALARIFGTAMIVAQPEATPAPTTEMQPEPKRKTEKPAPQPEAPAPIGAYPTGTGIEDDDDLPPDDAPAPKKTTPSEDDARKAVKAARDRGVPAKVIKEFMKEAFDIASSVECPAEKRQALIEGLNKLAA